MVVRKIFRTEAIFVRVTQIFPRLLGAESTNNLVELGHEPTPDRGTSPLRYASIFAATIALLAFRSADGQQVLAGSRRNKGIEPIVAEIFPAHIEATIRLAASRATDLVFCF
jgi:hypothetical protein